MALGNDARVVMLTGDGSFHMNLNEACTAVSYGLPIITVIFNNQVLRHGAPVADDFLREALLDTDPHRRTDFVKLAEGLGPAVPRCDARRVHMAFADAMQQKARVDRLPHRQG